MEVSHEVSNLAPAQAHQHAEGALIQGGMRRQVVERMDNVGGIFGAGREPLTRRI